MATVDALNNCNSFGQYCEYTGNKVQRNKTTTIVHMRHSSGGVLSRNKGLIVGETTKILLPFDTCVKLHVNVTIFRLTDMSKCTFFHVLIAHV